MVSRDRGRVDLCADDLWVSILRVLRLTFFSEIVFSRNTSNLLIGIRDYISEYQNIIAMDYSRQIGFRPLTRKIVLL